jgi:DNA-binding transcriptional MocR family regulator
MTDDLAQGTTANTISLLLGHPDPTTLFTPEFQAAVESVLHQPDARRLMAYGPEQGTPRLIRYLMDKFNRDEGLALTPDNLMIVAGSTHAVDMIARLYAKPGGTVLVEAPTYADSLHIFRDHHLDLCSIPIDENGIIVAELEARLSRLNADGKTPAFLYTIPTFQNPSGATLPVERKIEIVRLAKQYGFLIVEDDVYRPLAFEGDVPPSFYEVANGDQTLSIGSFSKTLAPGLRLGWLIGSPEYIRECVACGTTQMGGGANPFTAQIVAEYCAQGCWEAHVERLRAVYQQRREVMLVALRQHMPDCVTWTTPAGGFFIWVTLPERVFAQQVKQRMLEAGVLVGAGNGYYITPSDGDHHLRLSYSFAPLSDLETGIRVLGDVIQGLKHG